jgi:hypothetical protein
MSRARLKLMVVVAIAALFAIDVGAASYLVYLVHHRSAPESNATRGAKADRYPHRGARIRADISFSDVPTPRTA